MAKRPDQKKIIWCEDNDIVYARRRNAIAALANLGSISGLTEAVIRVIVGEKIFAKRPTVS